MKKFLFALVAAVFVIHSGPTISHIRTVKMLEPSVRISFYSDSKPDGFLWSGSGTIVKETDANYYIITNRHVAEDKLGIKDGHFEVFNYRGEDIGKATVQALSDSHDLALMKLPKGGMHLDVASICDTSPSTFDDVYAIGAGLGREVAVSSGVIANPYAVVVEAEDAPPETMYMHTAPIYPGNSGGGLFVRMWHVSYCMVGINTAVATLPSGFAGFQVLASKAYAIPLPAIRIFLSSHLP